MIFNSDIKIIGPDWTLSPKQQQQQKTNLLTFCIMVARLTNALQFYIIYMYN